MPETKAEQIRLALELGDYSVRQIADAFGVRIEYVRVVRQRMQPGGAAGDRKYTKSEKGIACRERKDLRAILRHLPAINERRCKGMSLRQVADDLGLKIGSVHWIVGMANRYAATDIQAAKGD